MALNTAGLVVNEFWRPDVTVIAHGQQVYIDHPRVRHPHQAVFVTADAEAMHGTCTTAPNGRPGPAHPEFVGFIAMANVIARDPAARTAPGLRVEVGQLVYVAGRGYFTVELPGPLGGDACRLTPVGGGV